MSEHIDRAIAEFEATIVKLTGLIENLRWFQREFPHTAAAVVPIEQPRRKYKQRAVAVKPKARRQHKTNERTNEQSQRQRAHRSLPDGDMLTAKILEQLHRRSPMSPADLTAAVKADKVVVRARVKKLEAAGQVTTSGVSASRLIHLANGKTTTAAGPKPNGSMNPPAAEPSRSSLAEVEERDRAVLLRIKGAGQAGRSIRELMITLGENEGALVSSIDRLRIKKQIQDDGNGKWVSA
jgi:hypothetical protein